MSWVRSSLLDASMEWSLRTPLSSIFVRALDVPLRYSTPGDGDPGRPAAEVILTRKGNGVRVWWARALRRTQSGRTSRNVVDTVVLCSILNGTSLGYWGTFRTRPCARRGLLPFRASSTGVLLMFITSKHPELHAPHGFFRIVVNWTFEGLRINPLKRSGWVSP